MKHLSYILRTSVIAVLALAAATRAEDAKDTTSEKPARMMTVGIHMSAGGFYGNLDKFDNRVADLGYAGLKDYAYELGMGTFKRRKRLVTGLELKGIAWRPADGANASTELYSLSGIVNVGFNVLPRKAPMLLYPYVGVGSGRLLLRLRQETATFHDAVTQPLEEVTLTQRTVALQAGVGGDVLIPRRAHPGKSRTIGFRLGYIFDPTPARKWYENDIRVTDGPSVAMTGFYGQVTFGKSREMPVRGWWHKDGTCDKSGCGHRGSCKEKHGK